MAEPTSLRVPGDKSISHRALMIAPLAAGISRVRGLAPGADVRSTGRAMRALGVNFEDDDVAGDGFRVEGPVRLRSPDQDLDCGNSGTSARILLGLLSGCSLKATLDGDASLRRRPMDRVTSPLRAAGGRFRELGAPGRLPIEVTGGALGPLRHETKVASAQVKTALLLAGLTAGVEVEVLEPGPSRDHTERMLRAMGARVVTEQLGLARRITLEPTIASIRPLDFRVPGDFSSAAFFLVLGVLGGAGAGLRIEDVGLNPGRVGLLEALTAMGGDIDARITCEQSGEPVGVVTARPSELRGIEVAPEWVPGLLDEIPALVCAAARARGRTVIRGAGELRVKESDRIASLAVNLSRLGVRVKERADGLVIEGGARTLEGGVSSEGDHRIAMAFGVLGALPGNRVQVDDHACVEVSYPGFWDELARLTVAGGAAGRPGPP